MSRYIDPKSKLLGHVDRIAEINAGGKPAPVNVEVDLTNRCNLGCDGCHFAHVHTRGPLAKRRTHDSGDVFDYPLIDQALRQMRDFGVRSVVWTGGGEPTLHPFFDAVVDDCPLPQGIYTNGTMVDELRADLLKRRMEWVYVSLDNHTKESYQAYKKVDGFERACQGVRNLVDAGGRATVGVGYLLHSGNWRNVPAMIEHGLGLGADYVNFRPMIAYDQAHPGQAGEDTGWINDAHTVLRLASGQKQVILDVDRFLMYRDWKGHGYQNCQWAQMQTVITPDGRVWACVNRRGFEGSALGDLHVESFEDIWARSRAWPVNGACRVMCRGHLPNLMLDAIRQQQAHGQFI